MYILVADIKDEILAPVITVDERNRFFRIVESHPHYCLKTRRTGILFFTFVYSSNLTQISCKDFDVH